MKLLLRDDFVSKSFCEDNKLTKGKMYKIHSINRMNKGPFMLDCYNITNDSGQRIDVPARLFRDLNTQEFRNKQLSKLGI